MATGVRDAGVVPGIRQREAVGRRAGWTQWLKHVVGLDRAIAYTLLARVAQIAGSTGTVLLILRYLTPVEQGYYYTLLSLVSLQTVFELGFSFVILQMAAHESVHLKFLQDGRIEGDPTARARLASILQKTLRWYLVAAFALCVGLLPLGEYFFLRHAQTGAPVAWQGPWLAAVLCTAVLFFLNPFFSFLEGCGQVWQAGRMRFGQALFGALAAWGALLSGHGLYSPGAVVIAYIAVGGAFLWFWRRPLVRLLRDAVNGNRVSWRAEVWPFQWKIAVSWICTYFAAQILTPVLFAYRGPAEAGRFGMSLSIATYLCTLVLAWMSTKATLFGKMVARGDFTQLRGVFFRTLRQSMLILAGISAACEAGVVALHYLMPHLAARMVSPTLFTILLLATLGSFLVQSMGIYLRSFKREPFLMQSVVVAVLTVLLSLSTVKAWGTAGVGASYLLCTGVIGLALGAATFHAWQGGQGQGLRRADVLVGAP